MKYFKLSIGIMFSMLISNFIFSQSVGIGSTSFTPGSTLSVSGNLSVGTYSTTAAPTNGMIISGNVGIGTSTVGAQLELPQNVALKVGDFYLSSGGNYAHMSDNNWYNGTAWSSNNENRVGSLIQLSSGGINFYTTSSGTGVPTFTNLMTVLSTGNVGIGSSSPAAKLDVSGSSGTTIKIVDGNQGSGKVLTSDANGVGSWSTLSSTSGTAYTIVGVANSTAAGMGNTSSGYTLNDNKEYILLLVNTSAEITVATTDAVSFFEMDNHRDGDIGGTLTQGDGTTAYWGPGYTTGTSLGVGHVHIGGKVTASSNATTVTLLTLQNSPTADGGYCYLRMDANGLVYVGDNTTRDCSVYILEK